MLSKFVLQKTVTVTGVKAGCHISHVSSDQFWINDDDNLILANTAGDILNHLTGIKMLPGVHTVNNEKDLIYIDDEYNINKLSNNVKSTFIKYTAPWRPQSVYSSPSTGELLVGMENSDTRTLQVNRYNTTGQHIQTIQHDNPDLETVSGIMYITENRNGDIIVSNSWRGVVVTEGGGNHRFIYRGHPPGSFFIPCGICTDALSRILVGDGNTRMIHIIDKDGNFLSEIQGDDRPGGLSYDDSTNLLWVGSLDNNTVKIYRCIYEDYQTGK